MRAIALCYHDVASPARPGDSVRPGSPYTLEDGLFIRHLNAIHSLVDPSRVRAISRRFDWQQQIPLFFTFDDGGRSAHSTVAGLLESFGWAGHFFVTTDWIGRPGFLDRPAIVDLRRRGHVIGSHSCSHPERMSHLSDGDLRHQWAESCQVLSAITGEPVRTASVAGGYYSPRVGRAAAACGIEVLFTSEPTATVRNEDGCMILGRYAIRRSTPPAVAAALADGARRPCFQQAAFWSLKKIVKYFTGRWFVNIRAFLLPRLPQA